MPPNQNEKQVILAADDDEDAQLLLERAFRNSGVNATLKLVSNGQEAIDYLTGVGRFADRAVFPLPNLLLLDLKMPLVSGFGVLEFLQKDPEKHKFPTIVFSCSNNPKDIANAESLGCHSYVVKPGDFKALVELLKSIAQNVLNRRALEPTRAEAKTEAPIGAALVADSGRNVYKSAPMQRKQGMIDSPELFKLLVEQVMDYAIFVLDTEGYVRSWNEGARRIKGYEPNEIIGHHFSIFYPRQDIDSDKPGFELRMVREMGRYEEEGWRLRKDGSRFWANVVITPLRDANRKLTGFAKITRDLTQRKLQEDHLQRLLDSEERFRLLVDQVKDYAIFFLDARGHISSWNQGARRIKGYSADEIIGKHFSTFYTPEDLATDKPGREIATAIREGRYEEEGWRLRKDGTRFWASVVITALWDKRGNLSGFAKVTRDLTRRKQEEEALKARTEELEAFAHTLSHDLRAPVRSIMSFSELLREERAQLSPEEQQAYITKINRSAQTMETLIRDILQLSQVSLSADKEENVALEEVVEEALALLESEITARKGVVTVSRPLPIVKVNRTLILQVLSNLIANGLKFTKPGEPPRVEIYSIPREFECEIHVKDFGRGIPSGFHDSIFQLFDRGTSDSSSSGTGIGLAIVRRAIQRFGGNVKVLSQPGEGSDFVVTVPCNVPVLASA